MRLKIQVYKISKRVVTKVRLFFKRFMYLYVYRCAVEGVTGGQTAGVLNSFCNIFSKFNNYCGLIPPSPPAEKVEMLLVLYDRL